MPSQPHELPFTAADVVRTRLDLVHTHDNSDRTERPQDEPCIEGVLATARQGAYYLSVSEGEADVIHLAGMLLYHLAKKHCFTDGNKRIAWYMTVDYLLQNGLEVTVSEEEAANFVLAVADNLHSTQSVIEWLGQGDRLRAYHGDNCSPPDA
jgi:death on curing protein